LRCGGRPLGPNTVISPAVIGGHLLVESALGDENVETLADRIVDVSVDRSVE